MKPKYERVSSEDDAASDQSLLDCSSDRSSWFHSNLTGPRHSYFNISAIVLLVYSLLSTTALIVLTAISLSQLHLRAGTFGASCHSDRGFKAAFGRDHAYMSVDHKFDPLWEDLNGTSVVLSLPDEERGGEPTPASISMFHQLHCLSALRHAIQMAREGHDPGVDYRDNSHWPHCLDYLKKTILCWADGSLERLATYKNGTKTDFIDGSQDVRQCGDNRALMKMMRDHGMKVTTEPFPYN